MDVPILDDINNIESIWIKFEGDFINDEKQGYGTYILVDGSK